VRPLNGTEANVQEAQKLAMMYTQKELGT